MKMVSPHFSKSECVCRCGCGFDKVSPRLLMLAEKVREIVGNVPMIVRSVCRCPERNKHSGGVINSRHMLGQAMDFYCISLTPEEVYKKIISAFNFGRLPELGAVFLYDWGVHIDIRSIPDGRLRMADYRKKQKEALHVGEGKDAN